MTLFISDLGNNVFDSETNCISRLLTQTLRNICLQLVSLLQGFCCFSNSTLQTQYQVYKKSVD